MNKFLWLPVMGLTACWVQDTSISLDDNLWDSNVVAASDGVYVALPFAEMLVRVRLDSDSSLDLAVVDLDGARVNRMVPTPDGSSVLVFAEWDECKDEDSEIVYRSDCPSDELVTNSELAIVSDAQRTQRLEIPSHLNTIEFSPDNSIAVAYLDYSLGGEITIEGVADLGEVAFINLADEASSQIRSSISVGFSPNRVLFGTNNDAVVMSRSQVVVVDLTTFEKTLEAPLTLDADQQIDPSGAELAYDEESGASTLLLTVQGSSDLYMLNLASEFWNIGDLGAIPSAIGVDNSSAQSVFVFGASSKAVILDHASLASLSSSSIEDISLEEPANKTILGSGFALLYHDSNDYVHDVYRIDLDSRELTEYVLANPLSELQLSPSGQYAVGIMRPENGYSSNLDAYQDSRWGIAILNTLSDDVVSLVAESQPIAVEIIENQNGSFALVLMNGLDYLLQIDLSQPSNFIPVEMDAAPLSLSKMPADDGRFLISHDVDMGMVSFLDPTTLEITSIDGFAVTGLLNEQILPRRAEEE
ncbi:MAG: hypothetical protein VX278_11080 [Myxococcota bacterium]|nr:hypothetical protein [Myxococcota bacterium]